MIEDRHGHVNDKMREEQQTQNEENFEIEKTRDLKREKKDGKHPETPERRA